MQTLRATAKIAAMKRYLWLAFLILLPILARAQGASLTVSCDPPTLWTPVCRTPTDCDAPKPITTPLAFNLYKPGQAMALDSRGQCVFPRTNLSPGTYQHYVTAVTSGIESDPSATVTSIIPPADPVCAGAPANETRSQACPAPTTGTFEQAHGWTSVAAPACWSADPWTPATPEPGSCLSPLVTISTSVYEFRSATAPLALIGLTKVGIPCGPETQIRNAVKYCRVPLWRPDGSLQISIVSWPANLAGTDFWARAQ